VRRPKAGRPGRRAFVSGKMRQNTKKATVITDGQGRTLVIAGPSLGRARSLGGDRRRQPVTG
ncbi:hypothetical protein ACFYYV_17010, partial [Streptomyces sp. NPDC001978]